VRGRVLALLLCLVAASCAPEEKTFRKSTVIMDTVVTITVVADSSERAESAIDAAFDEIHRLEVLLSFWTDDSEIAAIYHSAGKRPVKVSPETLDIIAKSIYISEKTGGAFDPTVGPLMRLWDFKEKKMPTDEEIEEKVGLVDYRQMETDRENSTAFLKVKGMSFDTGGIAKGYAVDKAVEALRKEGIESGLVAIAGDIRGFGPRTWNIGIRDPRANGEKDGVMATIKLKDKAISTSGDYERFFIKDGVRYHHLLNPNTGLPARGTWSASVIANEAVLTDGLATGVFVMGPEKGLKLLNELGIDGIIVANGGEILTTKGLEGKIELKR
jgi:thiamine biosynthesis lipoprotein